ncbi:hypothetical protein EJB05_51381, partial [Eragrostis curvula]
MTSPFPSFRSESVAFEVFPSAADDHREDLSDELRLPGLLQVDATCAVVPRAKEKLMCHVCSWRLPPPLAPPRRRPATAASSSPSHPRPSPRAEAIQVSSPSRELPPRALKQSKAPPEPRSGEPRRPTPAISRPTHRGPHGPDPVGEIPVNIGQLNQLESLEISHNELSGVIPPSMSALTSLSIISVSYNDLSGNIPTGNQFETFGASSYIGNIGLCGRRITESCPGNASSQHTHGHHLDLEDASLYLAMITGFVLNLWTVFFVLLLKGAGGMPILCLLTRCMTKFT